MKLVNNIQSAPDGGKKNLRGRSPQANYTDGATAACRRS
jgi:hypothetical protein